MSLNDPAGTVVDLTQVVFIGIENGLLGVNSESVIGVTLGAGLDYAGGVLSMTPALSASTITSPIDTLTISLTNPVVTPFAVFDGSTGFRPYSDLGCQLGDSLHRFTICNAQSVDTTDITSVTYKIGANTVLSAGTLGGSILTSALTSLGNLVALNMNGNIAPTTNNTRAIGSAALSFASVNAQTYNISGNSVLFGVSLGPTITTSSLTSLGNLVALNMNGNIAPTTTGTRSCGTSGLRWAIVNTVDASVSNNLQVDGTTVVKTVTVNGDNLYTCGSSGNKWASVNSTAYNIGANTILSGSTLGATITASSLTSLGSLTGLNVAGNILPTTTNTRTVGSAALSFASVNATAYAIGANTVLSGSTLGATITASSLTSIGTIAAGVNIATGQTYKVNGTAVLSSTTLGSTVTASSLTSVSVLAGLNMGGNITGNVTNTYRCGTTSNKFLSGAFSTVNTDSIDPILTTTLSIGPNATDIQTGNTAVNTATNISILTTTAGVGNIKFSDGTNSGVISYSHSTDTMTLTAGAAPFCTMQTAGDDMMLIGTSSLDRVGLRVYRPNSTTSSIMRCYSDSGGANTIQFRIGATGIVYAQNTTIQSVSDKRKKKDINYTDTSDYLNRWEAIGDKLCEFKWKRSNDSQCYGLIAQDMEELDLNYIVTDKESGIIDEDGLPDDVNGSATKILNGDYLHHIMRGTIYQLVKENKSLKNKLSNLETRLLALEEATFHVV